MSGSSFADILSASRQMVTAVQANKETLAARGASATFIQKGTDTLAALEAADTEQERLKAALKSSTAQVDRLVKEMTDWQNEACNTVKLAYRDQKQKWIEFGIKAKR
jgi:hypothetical protein